MEQQFVVNCDWFSFSVLLPLTDAERLSGAVLNCPPDLSLFEVKGTNLYKRRVLVFDKSGNKFLTLLLQPFSSVLKPESMFVEVANSYLYHDFTYVLSSLAYIHEFSFQSLSRYDVACDFNPTVSQLNVIDGLQDTTYYVAGKRQGAMFYDYVLPHDGGRQQRVARCLSWGSKASNIKWKLYNKSLEITEIDNFGRSWCVKPWIQSAWRVAGLDVDNVWRLEVSVMSASNYNWRGEHLDFKMSDIERIVPFFWDMAGTRFVVRANQGHKCRKWDSVVPFLAQPSKDCYRLRKKVGDGSVLCADHAVTLRAAMTQLERPEVQANPRMFNIWLNAAESVIDAGRLQGYFLRVYGMPWDVYRCNMETV